MRHSMLRKMLESEDRYFLYRHPETNECHIFIGKYSQWLRTCESPSPKSVCERVNLDLLIEPGEPEPEEIFACEEEQAARDKCATLGREVCGTCVSTLYATEKE